MEGNHYVFLSKGAFRPWSRDYIEKEFLPQFVQYGVAPVVPPEPKEYDIESLNHFLTSKGFIVQAIE